MGGGGGGGDCCRHWIQWKGVSKEQGGYSSASLFSGRATVFSVLGACHCLPCSRGVPLSSCAVSSSGSSTSGDGRTSSIFPPKPRVCRAPAPAVMASGKSCRRQRDVLWTRGPRAGHCCTARNRVGPRTE